MEAHFLESFWTCYQLLTQITSSIIKTGWFYVRKLHTGLFLVIFFSLLNTLQINLKKEEEYFEISGLMFVIYNRGGIYVESDHQWLFIDTYDISKLCFCDWSHKLFMTNLSRLCHHFCDFNFKKLLNHKNFKLVIVTLCLILRVIYNVVQKGHGLFCCHSFVLHSS